MIVLTIIHIGNLKTILDIWTPNEIILWSGSYPKQYAIVVIIWGHFIMAHQNGG